MIELLVVLAVVAALFAVGLLGIAAPTTLMTAGVATVALGLLVGVPAGALYHLHLYRGMIEHGPAPRRWWLRPARYHSHVRGPRRAAMLAWFVVGAVGFILCITGCVMVLVSAMRWDG